MVYDSVNDGISACNNRGNRFYNDDVDRAGCRPDEDAAAISKVLRRTVCDCQTAARVEEDPIAADARAVERKPAQHNGVLGPRVDVDGITARDRDNSSLYTIRAGNG